MSAACSCLPEGRIAAAGAAAVEAAAGLLEPQIRRPEARRHAADYLRGLIADVERKNGWQLAEQAGYAHPRGIQRVLYRYAWDPEAVRDDLLRWTIRDLGDPAGV